MRRSPLPLARTALGHETVRFVITGGSAAVLFYLFTVLFIDLGAPPFAGTLTAYGIAFVASYSVQHAWTFRGRQAHRRSLPRYLMAQAMAALVASTAARVCSGCGAPATVAAAASTLSGSVLSFFLSKYWVFAHRGTPGALGA